MKLAAYISRLGYGSRKEIEAALRAGRVCDARGMPFAKTDQPDHDEIYFDDEPLDPPPGLLIIMHKPVGYTCSREDDGPLVYDLLPPRFLARRPPLSTIGRLDKDTSGILLFTDDGHLLHRLISPKSKVEKVYEVTLARPLEGHEAALFASGELVLRGETKPLRPARLEALSQRTARLTLAEGRYHQVRRMFAAAGNHVEALHRSRFGPFGLDGLEAGKWRLTASDEITPSPLP